MHRFRDSLLLRRLVYKGKMRGYLRVCPLLSLLSYEVMSRIAAPMVGGMVSSAMLTMLVIPAIYALVKKRAIFTGGRLS